MSSGGLIFIELKFPYEKSRHKFNDLVKGIEHQLFKSAGWHVADDANSDWLTLNKKFYDNCLQGEYGDHRVTLGGLSCLIDFIRLVDSDSYITPDHEKINCKEIQMDLFVENYKYIDENKNLLKADDIDYGIQFQNWENIPSDVAKMTVYEWVNNLLQCINPYPIYEETWT